MAAGKWFVRGRLFRNFPLSALRRMVEIDNLQRFGSSCRFSSSNTLYYLVVGLGNHSLPQTRHSIGMTVVNHLADKLGVKWRYSKQFVGFYGTTQVNGIDVILLKPKLLMNINGRSVVKIASAYNIQPSNVILVHDDLDRTLGKHFLKHGGSAGGHNGVKSVIGCLMSCDFKRFLIGIGRPHDKSDIIDYVLEDFNDSEKRIVENIKEECCKSIIEYLQSCTSHGFSETDSHTIKTPDDKTGSDRFIS